MSQILVNHGGAAWLWVQEGCYAAREGRSRYDDAPDDWAQFTPINAEFFADHVTGHGSTRGAAVGTTTVDHPTGATWDAT